ncbi:lipoprotein-releasing ABC transporter permease subunit [Alteromonas sp. 345S023]|uniref:Lipoprotein-releasing ABC transporter permease subunit n=1 Tax=Alteromonas profundi TaxID=2696062 RepID=A0A7X5LIJ4_9ALTE|nr:lipoprotein-releasing ABC transporter permease subunit [Alteromonas profundi]NDV90022.1 lipoprotein-releasing ABC transporter permease subunit [Alteromonas profundi]
MSLSWQLARRFRTTKAQNRFISFISLSSTVGIALGCFVLIILLSVMNGFERELTHRILAIVPHGEIYSVDNRGIENLDAQLYRLNADPRVKKVEPYTELTGMLQYKGTLKAVALTGILIDDNPRFAEQVSNADWQRFSRDEDSVLIGKAIAKNLGLQIGDTVRALIPVTTKDLRFSAPTTITLTVAGLISVGGELDNQLGLLHLSKASAASGITGQAMGLRFTLEDPFSAYATMRDIGYTYPQAVYMSDWTRTQGHLYNDIQLVRTVVYIALALVIAVACFNIVSSLVMSVREKQPAIAILKTMGATDSLIRHTFMLQGALNGVIGMSVGVGLALLIAPNLSRIVQSIENILGIHLLSGDIYFIDFLPSELMWQDVAVTVVMAIVLSVLATIYPAYKAAKVSPSQSLH